MRLHREHHLVDDHKTPPGKVGLNQPSQLSVYRQTVKKKKKMNEEKPTGAEKSPSRVSHVV